MYVREKKIRRGDKSYSYWQVVRGTRVDGKVRQTVVAHVGVAEDREQADKLARMEGLLCGVLGCGEAATQELEHRGFRPTYTLKLPGRAESEHPYLLCPAHVEAWRSGERLKAWPLLGRRVALLRPRGRTSHS
jgi:hypothetical protein